MLLTLTDKQMFRIISSTYPALVCACAMSQYYSLLCFKSGAITRNVGSISTKNHSIRKRENTSSSQTNKYVKFPMIFTLFIWPRFNFAELWGGEVGQLHRPVRSPPRVPQPPHIGYILYPLYGKT